jgi:hypothetical protein
VFDLTINRKRLVPANFIDAADVSSRASPDHADISDLADRQLAPSPGALDGNGRKI